MGKPSYLQLDRCTGTWSSLRACIAVPKHSPTWVTCRDLFMQLFQALAASFHTRIPKDENTKPQEHKNPKGTDLRVQRAHCQGVRGPAGAHCRGGLCGCRCAQLPAGPPQAGHSEPAAAAPPPPGLLPVSSWTHFGLQCMKHSFHAYCPGWSCANS